MLNKPELIVVDDHLIFRQGLIAILTNENIATVIGEASNGDSFLKLLPEHHPDVVLMDIHMPGMDGIEATGKALKIIPGLKIIVYTMFGNEEYFLKMMELGIKGFILKSCGIEELEKAIQAVMRGETYFPDKLLKIYQKFNRRNNTDRDNTANVTNLAASGTTGISGTPNNVTGSTQTVTYKIIPTTDGCAGNALTATVTVKPEPVGVATPASQTVCSDATITTIVQSTSNRLSGTTYAWTRDNTTNVTGMSATVTPKSQPSLSRLIPVK